MATNIENIALGPARFSGPMMPVISDGLVVGLWIFSNLLKRLVSTVGFSESVRFSPIRCNLTPKTRIVFVGKWKQHFLSNMDRICSGNFGGLNGVWSNELMFKPTQIYNETVNKWGPQKVR